MLPENASTLLIAIGLGIAVYLLLRRRSDSASSSEREASPKVHRIGSERVAQQPLDDAPPELLRWQIEMHDTARELKGQLDCKLSALQALVALARRESDRLEAALHRAEQLDLPATASADAPPPRHTLAQLEALADSAALADPTALAAAARLSDLPGGVEDNLFDSNRRSIDLARLADQGLSPAEIAHRLSLPLGEVELLLSLRPA
jgi:DNA-binding NarL/FixJ family response regulator